MYRGKPIDAERHGTDFVHGYYLKSIDEEHIIWFQTKKLIDFGQQEEIDTHFIEVHPDSVGRLTGIREKYGKKKEVHESDIVKWGPADYDWDDYCDDLEEEEIGTIIWFQSAGRWALECKGKTYWPKDIDFFAVEVIGNTTDDKNLLETDERGE